MRRKTLVLLLTLVVALAAAGAASGANGGFTPPTPESPNARGIQDSYYLILGFTAAIFVLVESALVIFVVRFRSRGRSRLVEGPQIRGNTRLEIAWTVVPVLILAAIAAFVFFKLPGIKNVPPASAADRLQVRVTAHQFYWQFTYPNGVITIDRMRAPLGRVVTLDVTTPDVAHSWWIPALGGKIDAIPGRTNHTWFQAERTGLYSGQCAEFCGLLHAGMKATVEVIPADAFDRWLADTGTAQAAGTSDLGKELFEGVCAKCHGFQGQGYIGKALRGNPLVADQKGLTTIVRNGTRLKDAVMPAVGQDWTDAELKALLAYTSAHLASTGGSGGG